MSIWNCERFFVHFQMQNLLALVGKKNETFEIMDKSKLWHLCKINWTPGEFYPNIWLLWDVWAISFYSDPKFRFFYAKLTRSHEQLNETVYQMLLEAPSSLTAKGAKCKAGLPWISDTTQTAQLPCSCPPDPSDLLLSGQKTSGSFE